MTKMDLMNAKGTHDFPPEEKILRDKIEHIITTVFRLHGFSPIETPVLERFDLLASKYAGGAEILKETFKLHDQGKRELGLRYDLTVPFCRFIGMNPSLKMPFKRYQVGTVYRDGPVASDRLRTFTQCDADVVGTKNMAADAECLLIAEAVFKRLKIKAQLEINNRKFLDGLLDDLGVPQEKWIDAILIIDKIKKVEQKKLEEELEQLGFTKQQIKRVFTLLKGANEANRTNLEKIKQFQKELKSPLAQEGLKELEELFTALPNADKRNFFFVPILCRGLAYYTGTVYEAVAPEEEISSSIAAGGRYDKMIQQFLGSLQEYPAVGISFGLDRLYIIMQQREKEKPKTVTEVFVIPINTEKECNHIVQQFRDENICTETDLMKRGPSKNLQYANSLGIPFVLFVGEEEVKAKKYKLKNMRTGNEDMLGISECLHEIKKLRH